MPEELNEIHPTVRKLIKFSIRKYHSLLPESLKKMIPEAAKDLGLSEDETKSLLRSFYKEVFDTVIAELAD